MTFFLKSSLDWCESNYYYFHFIAEFFNTISNVPFLLLAAHYWSNKYPKNNFRIHSFSIFLIGFFSIMYHATLFEGFRWCDEISILFFMVYSLYIFEKSLVFCVWYSLVLFWFIYFFPLFSSIALIVSGLFFSNRVSTHISTHTYGVVKKDCELNFKYAVMSFKIGGAAWILERLIMYTKTCDTLSPPFFPFLLHSIFHFFMALSVDYFTNIVNDIS